MAVLRNLNVLSQMRIDVPHIRLLESAVAGDFDTLVGRAMAGEQALVVRGLEVVGAVGMQANMLALSVADSIVFNLNASETGSFMWIPAAAPAELLDGALNGHVTGAFVSGAVNYVGVDFLRLPDDSTIDLVKFKDPTTNRDTPRLVPLGKTLDHRIVITTNPFSAQLNVVPVAVVNVDSGGVVTQITDARTMMFRLGSGGDVPSPYNSYSWPAGRTEASGGDRRIASQKEWNDAVMTRLWEVGGGPSWFSPTADRNVHLTNTGSPLPNGDYWTFDSGSGSTTWAPMAFLFSGTTASINEVDSGAAILLDGQCVYVDLDRAANRTIAGTNPLIPLVGNLATIGTGSPPGSRWVLAWRRGTELYARNWRYPVGTTFTPATNLALGVVKLNGPLANPMLPTVIAIEQSGGNEYVDLNLPGTAAGTGLSVSMIDNAGAGPGRQAAGFLGGESTSNTGGMGVRGSGGPSDSGDGGVGVYGSGGTSNSGQDGVGVYGESGDAAGVSGFSTDAAGVVGISTNGRGVSAQSTNDVGIYGITLFGQYGVVGDGGTVAGVRGVGGGNGQGVRGEGAGTGEGVYGETATALGFGVRGEAVDGIGVRGGGGVVGVLAAGTGTNSVGLAAVATGNAKAIDATVANPDNVGIASNGHLELTSNNPVVPAGFTNILTPLNIPKAWGVARTGGTPTYAKNGQGFNMANISIPANDTVRLSFADPTALNTYCVLITHITGSATPLVYFVSARGTTYFDIQAYTLAGSLYTLFDSNAVEFSYMVMAAQ